MPKCGLLFKKKDSKTLRQGTFKIGLYTADKANYTWQTLPNDTLEIDGSTLQESQLGAKEYELIIHDVDEKISKEYKVRCEDGSITNSIYVGRYFHDRA